MVSHFYTISQQSHLSAPTFYYQFNLLNSIIGPLPRPRPYGKGVSPRKDGEQASVFPGSSCFSVIQYCR